MTKLLYRLIVLGAFCVFAAGSVFGQRQLGARPTTTGGPLSAEQAAYDVKHYDVSAQIFPLQKSIAGQTVITARIVSPTNVFVVDLDMPFNISFVGEIGKMNVAKSLKFERREGKIWIWFPMTKQTDDEVRVEIRYEGVPRVAPAPPWVGGFMWEKTADGSDWIAIACQNDGADVWFPVKDHPSDEADSVDLHITVPKNLYVASVGKLRSVNENEDDTKTYNWKMSNPINNYNIILNIAPYKTVEKNYKSVAGDTFPIRFYALPESAEKAPDIVDQTAKFLDFFEKYLGPYPFRGEKLGIAETPHLGMEHSTIIAYGNKFKNGENGFDTLMFHELGHEWWGNLVTASDWRDFWLHEGFDSFMDTLYLEEIKGKEAYLNAMKRRAKATRNIQPVAPREPKFAYEVYLAAPDYIKSDGDIYGKGAVVLHTLRYLIGDQAFFRALRRMAYPAKEMEKITTGRQTRFATTDDFRQIAEEESKMNLEWFFEIYLRQPFLPKLKVEQVENNQGTMSVNFTWETPDNLPFEMPIEVKVGDELKRIRVEKNFGWMPIQRGQELTVDPDGWILKAQ